MKQTIPFQKDITFKTKIGEITAISLDNDLMLKGEDLISGNFYISGSYKMIETSTIEESYSYKIPCEIAISDEYDTFDASVDIDDFYYEIIDDEVLRVNIVVAINNLRKKEIKKVTKEEIGEETDLFDDTVDNRCFEDEDMPKDEIKTKQDVQEEQKDKEFVSNVGESSENPRTNNSSFLEVKESVKKQDDTYLTYKVYIFKEGDNIEKILEKYNVSRDDLSDYNDLDGITVGSKIVIPSVND